MLLQILCLILCVSHCRANPVWQLSTSDGQPGCRTAYELSRLWRNNFEISLYWECTVIGRDADPRVCPPGTAFQDQWQTCVPMSTFEWTPPYDPPSRVGQPWSVTECPPCDTTTTTLCPPCPPEDTTTTTTVCPPCLPETTCPPCPEPEEPVTEDSTEVGGPGFICTAERLGIRWPGESSESYWECPGFMEQPFLISCPPGIQFNFTMQTCVW